MQFGSIFHLNGDTVFSGSCIRIPDAKKRKDHIIEGVWFGIIKSVIHIFGKRNDLPVFGKTEKQDRPFIIFFHFKGSGILLAETFRNQIICGLFGKLFRLFDHLFDFFMGICFPDPGDVILIVETDIIFHDPVIDLREPVGDQIHAGTGILRAILCRDR